MKRMVTVELTPENYRLLLIAFVNALSADLDNPAVFDEKAMDLAACTAVQLGCLSGIILGRLQTKVEKDRQREAIMRGIRSAIETGEHQAEICKLDQKGD